MGVEEPLLPHTRQNRRLAPHTQSRRRQPGVAPCRRGGPLRGGPSAAARGCRLAASVVGRRVVERVDGDGVAEAAESTVDGAGAKPWMELRAKSWPGMDQDGATGQTLDGAAGQTLDGAAGQTWGGAASQTLDGVASHFPAGTASGGIGAAPMPPAGSTGRTTGSAVRPAWQVRAQRRGGVEPQPRVPGRAVRLLSCKDADGKHPTGTRAPTNPIRMIRPATARSLRENKPADANTPTGSRPHTNPG